MLYSIVFESGGGTQALMGSISDSSSSFCFLPSSRLVSFARTTPHPMINLYSWYAAPQPGTLPHEPWTVVFWGRRRADHSPSSSSASTQRAPLENYTIIQRTSETTFDSTATKVRLVGPADSRRATQAGASSLSLRRVFKALDAT